MPQTKLLTNKKLFQIRLLSWYKTGQRLLPWRKNKEPYRIWVSEVMLQQTQVKTVIPYYLKFMQLFPALQDFAAADLEVVLKQWEGLGYYARARNFHKAANIVSSKYNGIIPDDLKTFKSLPGVGDYIAAAVLSIAFQKPLAVVDGNVKRVLSRMLCLEFPVNAPASHKQFSKPAQQLLYLEDPGTFNQAVMELGALVCTPKKPDCGACPVAEFCLAFSRKKTHLFPLRIKTKKVPTYRIAVGIVKKNKKVLITRRKLDGLLGGLWEFPGGKLKKGEDAPQACIREIFEETGLTVKVTFFLTRIKHAYTHFKIEMDVFYCRRISGDIRLNGPIDFKWVTVEHLNKFAFPKANLKFIPLITAGK